MAGKFHRFTDPAYFLFSGETFPGTSAGNIGGHAYDRINVVSGGVGAGGSALADAQKASGPNVGTYFIAFGEDATSLNVNRISRAITESLDLVDDILRTSIPKYATQAAASPAANNIVITGDVFVGDSISTLASQLVYLTDANGNRIYNGLTPVTISDIDNGTPGSSVIGTGWFTNPTVRFNTAVNVAYVVTYGTRTSTARIVEQEREANWRFGVAAASLASQAASLALHGLDERYRRSTTITSPAPQLNTAGSGATFNRDGKGITAVLPTTSAWTTSRVPDPFLAAFRTEFDSYAATTSDLTKGGDIGYLTLSSTRASAGSSTERTAANSMAASSATYLPRDITADNIGGVPVRTYVPKGAAVVLNPGGALADTVRLSAPNYFHVGALTSIRPNLDVVVLTFGDGTSQAYVIKTPAGLADQDIKVVTLSGAAVAFASNTAATVQWFSYYVGTGGGLGGNDFWGFDFYSPAILASDVAGDGGMRLRSHVRTNNTLLSLGYTDGANNGASELTLYLDALGNIKSWFGPTKASGILQHALTHRPYVGPGNSGVSFTANFDPNNSSGGSTGHGMTAFWLGAYAGPASPQTVTVATPVSLIDGSLAEFFMHNLNGAIVTMAWPATFVFSSVADAQPGATQGVANSVCRWRGTVINNYMFMERVADYTI